MSVDYFDYQKQKNVKDAYAAVKKRITPDLMAKFKVKAEVNYDDSSCCIEAKGKGFTMKLDFEDGRAKVDLDLSLMFKPFKGAILSMIGKEMSKVI